MLAFQAPISDPSSASSTATITTTSTPHPVFAPGRTALITGAASGIGLAIAKLCATHFMNLILLDTDLSLLLYSASRESLGLLSDRQQGDSEDEEQNDSKVKVNVTYVGIDVGDIKEWKEKVVPLIGEEGNGLGIDLVVLNAGTGRPTKWSFEDKSNITNWEKTFQTNVFGVVNGVATTLPYLQKAGVDASNKNQKAIVITGSKQGITNPPSNPAYNASKAAVKSLAESLSFDLRNNQPTPISVHLLIPGWTFTGMTGARAEEKEKPEGAWYPSQVAEYMYNKMGEGKFYILCPDNDVSEEVDRKRIRWAVGDVLEGREALSRWREGRKEEFEAFMRG